MLGFASAQRLDEFLALNQRQRSQASVGIFAILKEAVKLTVQQMANQKVVDSLLPIFFEFFENGTRQKKFCRISLVISYCVHLYDHPIFLEGMKTFQQIILVFHEM